MSNPEHLLTFEMNKEGDELTVHMNQQGLALLQLVLARLQNGSSPMPRHTHLMTDDWGGDELSSQPQSTDSTLFNKVDLRLWG